MFGKTSSSASIIVTVLVALVGCTADIDSPGGTSAAISTSGRPACFVGECVPESTPIYAGQHIEVGSVSVASSGDELVLAIQTTGDWTFGLVHVYAGTDPVPTNRAGAPAPGRFPYHYSFASGGTSTELRLPITAGCGDTLNVAVHLEVTSPTEGSETAWAFGSPFARGWGWSFTYDVCCGGTGACLQPPDFWRDHPTEWPPYVTTLGIAGDTYGQAELIAILGMDPAGDVSIRLAQAWIALKLSWYCGVPVSDSDWETMHRTSSWFYRAKDADPDGRMPFGVDPASPLGVEGTGYAEILEAFNAGESTAPLCH